LTHADGVIVVRGGASAGGAQVADALTHKAVVSHEITLGEEEIADVSLATFYVFDKENAGPSRHSERLACGCWTGTYYTSGNDAYPTPLRPVTQPHGHVKCGGHAFLRWSYASFY
jgi:hypothetical protein